MKTYNDKIATVGAIFTVIGIMVSVLIPEIRDTIFGVNSKGENSVQINSVTKDSSTVFTNPNTKINNRSVNNNEVPTKLEITNESQTPIIYNDKANNAGILNGEWYSPEYKYSFSINGNKGIATLSNSPNYKVGDIMILIKSFDGEYYYGTQIFTDGQWHQIKLKFIGKDEIVLYGYVEWTMIRNAKTDS